MTKFLRDNRGNEKLHKLYVQYAHEELTLLDNYRRELMELSRVNPSIVAGKICEEIRQLVEEDAAYAEAAAMIFAGIEIVPEQTAGIDQ